MHTQTTLISDTDPGLGVDRRGLAAALIALNVVTIAGFVTLSAVFDFPEILRADPGEVLPLFLENSGLVRTAYWALAMTGFLLAAAAVGLSRMLRSRGGGTAADLVGGFGVMTGIFWAIGYIRWPILMPYLADRYPTSKDDAATLYEFANRYGGMAIGEHLGFIAMGAFAIALAIAWRRANLGARWLTPVGVFAGVFIAVTGYEQLDTSQDLLGALNGAANTIWFLWLLAMAIVLLRHREN